MKPQSQKRLLLALILILTGVSSSFAQNNFQNLNFGAATNLPSTTSPTLVPVTNALPGWTVYEGGVQATQVFYNGVSGGSAEVTLVGTSISSSFYPPLDGNYSATLDGGETGTGLGSAEIAQTGTIPRSTDALFFSANYNVLGYLTIAFNGQNLPYVELSSTPNYQVYGANISQFAGETGVLSFTETPTASTPFPIAYLDDIQFSPTAIPEPGTCALILCGTTLLGLSRWKRTG